MEKIKKILVFGASSAIAEHLCRLYAKEGHPQYAKEGHPQYAQEGHSQYAQEGHSQYAQEGHSQYAQEGCDFHLVGRSELKISTIAKDLLVRGARSVETTITELDDYKSLSSCFEKSSPDICIIAHASLTNQKKAEKDSLYLTEQLHINLISYAFLINEAAAYFDKTGKGHLVLLGSIAGDRARKKNYYYGASKNFLKYMSQGFRHRFAEKPIYCTLVKPGFVDTPMTEGFKKGLLFSTPPKVAQDIFKAIEKKKPVLYTPWYWRFIMKVICSIPFFVFKRMNI